VGDVPPLVGVAVNVQPEAAHAGLLPVVSAMLTDGVTTGFTVMVMLFDVAVVEDAQAAFEVITQLTTSLLASELLLYVEAPLPTLLPLSFH
jgi:hypothetical protein